MYAIMSLFVIVVSGIITGVSSGYLYAKKLIKRKK
jgi:uncharacterized protein YneF (UPF0154 family)